MLQAIVLKRRLEDGSCIEVVGRKAFSGGEQNYFSSRNADSYSKNMRILKNRFSMQLVT